MDIGDLAGTISLEDEWSKKLDQVASSVTSKMNRVGDAFTKVGRTMTVGVTLPLVGAAAASLKFSADFEAQMTRLVSIAGVLPEELAGVKQHILDLAPAVGIGPGALAEAMTKVSSTVDNTKTALEILDIAAQGTKAGFGEVVGVAGALTTVINSYGAANITAARAGDILATAIKLGGAEASELAPVLANVVPFAAQLGVSFEEVAANLATMTKLGVPTAEAVTSLTSVFTALSKETEQGTKALDKLDMTYGQLRASLQSKGLAATLQEISDKTKGNLPLLTDIFGRIESVKNIMATAGVQGETYADVLDKIKGSSDGAKGSLQSMADAMKGTQAQTWNELKATMQVLAITMGNALAPSMHKVLTAAMPLLKNIVELANWFGRLSPPVQQAAIGFTALVAALGPMAMVIGAVTKGASMVMSGLSILIPVVTASTFAFKLLTSQVALFGVSAGITTTASHLLHVTLLKLLASPIGLIGMFTALAAASWKVYEAWNAFSTGDKTFIEFISIRDSDNWVRRWLGLSSAIDQVAASVKKLPEWKGAMDRFDLPQMTDNAVANSFAATGGSGGGGSDAAKKAAEDLAELNKKIADTQRQLSTMTPALTAQIMHWKDFGLSTSEVAQKLKLTDMTVDHVSGTVKQMRDVLMPAAEGMKLLEGYSTDVTPKIKSVAEQSEELHRKGQHTAGTLKLMGQELRISVLPGAENATQALKELREESEVTFGQKVFSAMGDVATILDNIGGKFAEVGAMAARTGQVIMKNLAEGNVWGAVIAGVTGAMGIIKKLFGGISEEVLKARKELDKFTSTLMSNASAAQIAQAEGEDWKLQVISVRDAYLATGRTADEALAVTERLWDTDHPDRMRAAIAEVNGVLAEHQQMLDDAAKDATDLQDAISRYGFTVAEMGPLFAQQKMTEQASTLMNDFRLLTGAGADFNVVLDKMGPSINTFVQDAIKMGSEVPSAMKPILQHMIDQGELIDINGRKFDSLEDTGVTFSDTISQALQKVVEKFEAILQRIGLIPPAIDAIPKDFTVRGHIEIPEYEEPEVRGMAAGGSGTVHRRTVFVAGEAGPEQYAFSGAGRNFAPSSGSGTPTTVIVPVNIDGREVARVVAPLLPRELEHSGVL